MLYRLQGFHRRSVMFKEITPILEKKMEKTMEHDMEIGGFIGAYCRVIKTL